MIAKIILLAFAVIGFVALTAVMQHCEDKDKLEAGIICGLGALICMVGSAAMFGAIATEVFS